MKQLTNNLLKVNFSGLELDKVEKIEFAFSQKIGDVPLKTEQYPSSETIKIADSLIGITWTKEDTMLFEAGKDFFLDTRITFANTQYQPETQIVRLRMNPTLFDE